jgi:hypothetical protein
MLTLIRERKPDLLLLSGDLFEGTQLHGRSENEDTGIMAPTRQLYLDCILTPLIQLAETVEIVWTFGSHDCRAWNATPGWEFWRRFPGRMVSVPYGEEIALQPARGLPVRLVAFGGLDATKNDRLWPEGTVPRMRDGVQGSAGRTGGNLYRKGIRHWSKRLEGEKRACIAISPTARPTGPYDESPFVYIALGGLQEVSPQRDYRVLPTGIRGAQGCPFRIKDGAVLDSPIAEVDVLCADDGAPRSVQVQFRHPGTMELWNGFARPMRWERTPRDS